MVSAVVLALAGIGGLALLSSNMRIGHDHGTLDVTPEHVVYAKSVRMSEGDRLLVRPELMGAPFSVLGNYTFYVVGGGDRYVFVDGGAPSTSYATASGLRTSSCCAHGDVVYQRADAPAAWSGSTPDFPPDADERMLVEAGVADPAYVDLVWVFEYRPGYPPPSDEASRAALDRILEEHFRQVEFAGPFREMPVVVSAAGLRAVPVVLGTMFVAAVAAGVSAIFWVHRLGRATVPETAGTEAWLRLYDAAGTYLTSVRDLLVASLVVAVLVALHVALQGEPGPLVELAQRAGVATGLTKAVGLAVAFLYLVVVTGWAVTLWRVQRALLAWRRRADAPPLET